MIYKSVSVPDLIIREIQIESIARVPGWTGGVCRLTRNVMSFPKDLMMASMESDDEGAGTRTKSVIEGANSSANADWSPRHNQVQVYMQEIRDTNAIHAIHNALSQSRLSEEEKDMAACFATPPEKDSEENDESFTKREMRERFEDLVLRRRAHQRRNSNS